MGPAQQEIGKDADDGFQTLDAEGGIHLVSPVREKKRPDAPPWPATATSDQPIQLSLFG
jgi:hypothetical protein